MTGTPHTLGSLYPTYDMKTAALSSAAERGHEIKLLAKAEQCRKIPGKGLELRLVK